MDLGEEHRNYNIKIHKDTLCLDMPSSTDLPEWVKLENHTCNNCPLSINDAKNCPASIALMPLIGLCSDLNSYDEVKLIVETQERVISQNTTVQRAISSLVGLVLPASGCPHTAYFRPMVHFHLPVSNELETLYRSSSMYMLAQYFMSKHGLKSDYDLVGLTTIYQNLQIVNHSLAARLRGIVDKDAAVNAVILLDMFARNIPYSLEEMLEEIEYMFHCYLNT